MEKAKPSTRASTPIHVEPGTRLIRIERVPVRFYKHGGFTYRDMGHWFVWINTKDFVHGTGLKLYADGRMERVTVYADGTEDVMTIKGVDTT